MTLHELYKHYGSWAEMTRQLNLGANSYQYWQRKGYIPRGAQYYIEKKTDGLFKIDPELKDF